jgi:signal transduction histidine kinase
VWQVVWRYLLALAMGVPTIVLFVAAVAASDLDPDLPDEIFPPWLVLVDLVLVPVSAVLIAFRRKYPRLIASLLACIATVSGSSLGFFAWAFTSLCTRRRWREQIIPGALCILGNLSSWFWYPAMNMGMTDTWLDKAVTLAFAALWLGVYAAVGWYIGARRDLIASLRERAETAELEQQLRVQQAQAGERARLAREMHDVVAHRISLVSLHAGALAYRDDLTPEETRAAALTIQENAHEALTELRLVLAELRSQDGPEAPQPTLADLPLLLDQTRETGTVVVLRDDLDPSVKVPTGLARHIYRIIQESLTNARKHAEGAEVSIHLQGGPDQGIGVEIRNPLMPGAGRLEAVPGAGLGIVGLRERAQLVKGTLTAERERGDFVVRAWLPWTS